MTARYVVRRADDAEFSSTDGIAPGATGFGRWRAVGVEDGSSHTDFGITRLQPGGTIPSHLHSFEESFHVLRGEVVLTTPEATVRLVGGDYGVIPIGVPHSWHGTEAEAVWTDVLSPPPRPAHDWDTYHAPALPSREPMPVDPRDPRTRSFGNITAEHMNPGRQSQELLAVSASMRTALLVYSGISLKMMVDSELGAVLHTMFMVQYEPDGVAGPHDHPLEEAYLITEGEVDATFDGTQYRLQAGDFAWAGAGCVHSFRATGAPVRWVETQSPQMPARHAYRFARDWDYLQEALDEERHD
ncbi:cupin domain-containing protein [Microbacterium caowuchunii]|uniref:cupin domain-containing protein n=1 Tax=Microbacterium caowuchunii TaxID=2614638 RepID=UPI0019310862|nr:cupin domain-containing protein [Microbacterium caowuchunii]